MTVGQVKLIIIFFLLALALFYAAGGDAAGSTKVPRLSELSPPEPMCQRLRRDGEQFRDTFRWAIAQQRDGREWQMQCAY